MTVTLLLPLNSRNIVSLAFNGRGAIIPRHILLTELTEFNWRKLAIVSGENNISLNELIGYVELTDSKYNEI